MPYLKISYDNDGWDNCFYSATKVNEIDSTTKRKGFDYEEIPDGAMYYIVEKGGAGGPDADYHISHWFQDIHAVHAGILSYIRDSDSDYYDITGDYMDTVLRSINDDTFEKSVDEMISEFERVCMKYQAVLIQLRDTPSQTLS
jgi:hypothetical protein